MGTARRDYPLFGNPTQHQFDLFLNSLAKQSFPHDEFECIIVDEIKDEVIEGTQYGKIEKRVYDFSKYDFKIKHVAPTPNYFRKHFWSSYGSVHNTGIIHADGELIIIINDCCELFPYDDLDIFWEWYKSGKGFANSIFEYWMKDKPLKHSPDFNPHPTKNGSTMRTGMYDQLVTENKIYTIQDGFSSCLCYSVSLQALFDVNGFNECFDGAKGLEDCDICYRLTNAGYKSLSDIRIRVIEHHHEPIFFHSMQPFLRSNGPLMDITLKRGKSFIKANEKPLSQEEFTYLKEWHIKNNAPFQTDNERLLTNPSLFDLKELWKKRKDGVIC